MEFKIGSFNCSVSSYMQDKRIAICLSDNEGPYCKLSTNVPEIPLEKNEFVLNHDLLHNMFRGLTVQLLESGFFKDTGRICSFGFCKNVPIWKLETKGKPL